MFPKPVLAVLCFLFFSPGRANLLLNGDFSVWSDSIHPSGWTVEDTAKAPVALDADSVHSPPYSARITRMVSGTGDNCGVSQFVAVQPGQDYTLSAWCAGSDGQARGGIGISWFASDTTYISATGMAYADTALSGWQRLERYATSPVAAGLARVLLRVYGFSGSQPGGLVYIDDADFFPGCALVGQDTPTVRYGPSLTARPNPGSGPVTFSVGAHGPGSVRVDVYGIAGCLRSRVYSGPAGERLEVVWRGADSRGRLLPSGCYFAVATVSRGPAAVLKLALERR